MKGLQLFIPAELPAAPVATTSNFQSPSLLFLKHQEREEQSNRVPDGQRVKEEAFARGLEEGLRRGMAERERLMKDFDLRSNQACTDIRRATIEEIGTNFLSNLGTTTAAIENRIVELLCNALEAALGDLGRIGSMDALIDNVRHAIEIAPSTRVRLSGPKDFVDQIDRTLRAGGIQCDLEPADGMDVIVEYDDTRVVTRLAVLGSLLGKCVDVD